MSVRESLIPWTVSDRVCVCPGLRSRLPQHKASEGPRWSMRKSFLLRLRPNAGLHSPAAEAQNVNDLKRAVKADIVDNELSIADEFGYW